MGLTKHDIEASTDEYIDLEYLIKDKVIIAQPPKDNESESIGVLLLKKLSEFPNHIGQINAQTGEETTFAQFKDRTVRCALGLQKLGIGKGDVVCTSIPLQGDDYVPVLATLFIGGIIHSWPHQITPVAAEHFFKLVKPKLMFSWIENIDMLVAAAKAADVECKFVSVGTKHTDYPFLNDFLAEQSQREVDQFRVVEPDDPKTQIAAYMFTSGTNYFPKVVMLTYDTLLNNRYHHFLRSHTTLLTYSTFSWTLQLYYFTLVIRRVLTRLLHSRFDAEDTAGVIERYQVNLMYLNPSMLTQLCKSGVLKKYDFSKLETIVVGGNTSSSALLEEARNALPNTHISNTLGMTDTAGRLTIQTKKCKTRNSLGRLVEGVQMKVINPTTGVVLGANQDGEMCFKAKNLMTGYLNNPEQTKNAIDDEGWLHSGDLGYYDENGEIWFKDRLKNIIVYRTANLSPTQIEHILLQNPDVVDAVVLPVPNEVDNERPFAFIVKHPSAEVTIEELIEYPGSFDKRFRLTGGVEFLDQIPYNANGKKCIKELKMMALASINK